ncbi:hypothetical protein [Streptomyces sp. 8L]|uniref:hypothetical protein n=1 Tax=Streptomyces sp. 8L TaxID=2877242 RepID=UPI001CD7C9EE|nr:hypothetical protein [Streptomyces sp. 8L]MCA1223238.1 hypothetical protein [Streptomyces sp. 8L]
MKDKLLDASQQWKLLDDSGHLPATPSYTTLLQHAADADDLARDVLRLTADFAQGPKSTTPAGSAVLRHLATATSLSSRAAPHFAETAENALALLRSSNPTDQHYLTNRMVTEHASGRACLRHTSTSLRDAVKELDQHLEYHHFLSSLTPRESPALPPPTGKHSHRR